MAPTFNGLFVTGTNTGVGKTHVTAIVARQLVRSGARVGIYKPACSGSEVSPNGEHEWPDVRRLSDALDRRFPDDWICPQRFRAALAPPDAAAKEGRTVDRTLLRTGIWRWSGIADVVLVEGVGGWQSPIADTETVADLAADFGLPVLLVVGMELGAVNHALLTLESIERCGLPIAGIVLNHHCADVSPEVAIATEAAIRRHARASILGTVLHGQDRPLTPDHAAGTVHWMGKCGPVVTQATLESQRTRSDSHGG